MNQRNHGFNTRTPTFYRRELLGATKADVLIAYIGVYSRFRILFDSALHQLGTRFTATGVPRPATKS